MKLAIISDIHGNSYALEQVLASAKKEKAEKLLVLGDIVGYYYHPDKVMSMLSEWDHRLIRGNHENYLAAILNGTMQEEELRKKYGSGHKMAIQKIPTETAVKLITAPEKLKVEFDSVKFLMCHGSPWDADHYLYPDAKPEVLEKCDRSDVDFVLAGHSHYQFMHRNQHSTFINVGSVGQSRTVGGIANWVMVNTTNKSVEMKATPYDTTALEKEVDLIDPNVAYLKEILKRNRD